MPRKRKFDKLSDKEQLLILVKCLSSALQEHPEFYDIKKHKTDIYGIACHYYKGIRREDFEQIEYFKIKDIIEIFSEGY